MGVIMLRRASKVKHPSYPRRRKAEGKHQMTVGVAAVARKGHALVVVADRLLTYDPYGAAMTGEAAATKLIKVADNWWYALYSGSPTFALAVEGFLRQRPQEGSR